MFLYFSLGFCLLIGSGLTSLQSRLYRYRWVLYSILSIYTIILASKTLHRNQVWQSRQSLFWSGVVTLPHNAKVHYNYGNYLKDTGNTSEAILHYREALSLYPVHASVHNNLGTLLTNQSEAEYHFKEARKYNSRHKGALVNLANIYHSKHQNELAESLINQALKIDPAYHLALMAFSKVLMETGRTEKAKKYIDAALQTEPHSADTHNYHGAYLHRTGKYSEAVSSYLTAYSLNNRDLSSVTNAASTLNTLGRVSEAEDLLKRALTVNPNVELKNQLGLLYYSSNNVSKSLTIYRNILKNAPNYTDAATNYAKILVSIDNLEEATGVIDNVLNQAPDNVDALQVKASVLVKKGEKTEAIQYLEFALQQSTSHIEDNDRLTTITFHLGALYQELKDLKTALRYFQSVVKIDPNHSKAHLHIGGIHHINNHFSIARKHYNEVLRLDPSNTFAKKNLEKLGRLEKKAKTVK